MLKVSENQEIATIYYVSLLGVLILKRVLLKIKGSY